MKREAGTAKPRPAQGKVLFSALALFTVLAVGMVALFSAAHLAMGSFREDILASFRERTGYDIAYRRISPAFFQSIEIRDLTISSCDAEKRVILAVKKIRLHYDLLSLFFERDKLRAIVTIEIEDGQAAFDAKKDSALIVFLESIFGDSNQEYRLSNRFSLSGRNVSLVYTDGEAKYAFRNLFASVQTEDSFLRFVFHARGEAGTAVAARGPDLTTNLDMQGRVTKDFSLLDADFRVESFKAGDVILKEQQFHIGLKDRTLDITKVQDRSPLDLSVRYSLDREVLSASFLAEDLAPQNLIAFTDKLHDLRPVLSSRISADGSLRYEVPRNDLDFSLTLDGLLSESVSPVAVRLHSRIRGTEDRIEFDPVTISSAVGRIEFSGDVIYKTILPEGRLRLTDVKTAIGEDLNADLTVERSDNSVTLTGEKVRIGSAGFRSFILDVFPRQGELRFAVASALDLPVSDNSITLDGSLTYERGYRLAIDGAFTSVPLNFPYRAFTKADRFSETLDRDLQTVLWSAPFSFSTDFNSYRFTAPDISVKDVRNSTNRLAFDVEASDDELKISPLRGSWAGYALAGDIDFRWRKKAGFDFTAGVSVNKEKYAFDGRYIPGAGIMMSGSYGFSLMLVPQSAGGQYLALRVASLPVPLPGHKVFATLDWIGTLSPSGDLALVSRRTFVTGIPRLIPGMENASADIRFSLSGGRMQIAELSYRDKISSLSGNGSFDLRLSPEPRADGWLYLEDENRVENYTAVANLSPGSGDLTLYFKNSPLEHWGDLALHGNASGVLTLHGPLSAPAVDLSAALGNGRLNGEPVTLKADVSLREDGITLKSLEGSYARTLTVLSGDGTFDLRAGTLNLRASVSAGNHPVRADVSLQTYIADFRTNEPLAAILDKNVHGAFSVVNRDAKEGELHEWSLRFFLDHNGFNVSGGPDEVLMGQMKRDGAFHFDLAAPFPLQGHFEGRLADNRIEARADGVVLLLPAINELVNTPFFVIRDGIARGNLTISGPAVDPDFFGVLTVDGMAASSLALADPVGPLSSVLEINEKKAVFRQADTKVGNCPVSVFAEMIVDHWNISRLTTRFAIDDPLGAHLTLPLDILAFDGYVTTPALILTADQSGVSIDGSLFVQKSDVVLGSSKPGKNAEASDSNLVVDLDLQTGKQVEFYWPAREFPILRMVSEPGAGITVKYNQLKDEFSLDGDINFKGGDVYYFERSFMIREGSLSLKETQLDFNPLLNLKAERIVRYNDQDVKITMSVPNQHLKDFAPVFDSDPPLPITERYLALGGVIQNTSASNSDEYLTSIVSDIGGDVLTQLVLLHPLEQKMKRLLNLDGFSIRTQFITNLILDTVFNSEENLAPDTAISMGRYLNNTEISFQKYLDERNNLFFETIVRIRTDLTRSSETGAGQTFGNVNVESEFSLELTTPFFLTIKWSITPEHWETFFLPDNKITFKWGMSF